MPEAGRLSRRCSPRPHAREEPHRIVFYVQELARDFQSYFTRLKGENDPILPPASVRAVAGWERTWDLEKTRARLAWIEAIRVTYAQALELVGVSAPERMERPADDADAADSVDADAAAADAR